jgi:hypothetical protein
MIVLGMLLVLIGFSLMASRGGLPGSAAARNVTLGRSHLFTTRGEQSSSPDRSRIIQIVIGLVLTAGGFALIAIST